MFPVIYYSRKGRKNNPFFSKVFGKIYFRTVFLSVIADLREGCSPHAGVNPESGLVFRFEMQRFVPAEKRAKGMKIPGYGRVLRSGTGGIPQGECII